MMLPFLDRGRMSGKPFPVLSKVQVSELKTARQSGRKLATAILRHA